MIGLRHVTRGLATALEAEAQLIPSGFSRIEVESFVLDALSRAAPIIKWPVALTLLAVGLAPNPVGRRFWRLLATRPGGRQTRKVIRGLILLRVAPFIAMSS